MWRGAARALRRQHGASRAHAASQRAASTAGAAAPGRASSAGGIALSEYRERRAALARTLPAGSLAIFPGESATPITRDIPHRYRQDSDMLYFSGFTEPDAVLLLRADPDAPDGHRSILVVAARSAVAVRWNGPAVTSREAVGLFGVDAAESSEVLGELLDAELESATQVYLDLRKAYPATTRHSVQHRVEEVLGGSHRAVSGLARHVDALKAYKSPAEIALMSVACEQATGGIHDAMEESAPGASEHNLAALIEYGARRRGAAALSFPPIVAGGPRAQTLHYNSNNQVVDGGDMVLVDAGAEHLGYASDISRTWPVSGRFSEAQRELYGAVLRVQLACIDLCRRDGEDEMSLIRLHQRSQILMMHELAALGVLPPGAVDTPEGFAAVRRYYPHSIGHYLGMDVHDAPSFPIAKPLEPGMVLTVEPGLYLPDSPEVPARYRGMGVRIEDDVLVTEGAPRVLTATCAKAVDEIEHRVAQARAAQAGLA